MVVDHNRRIIYYNAATICILGILTNLISLSYFLTKARTGLVNKLFILLNTLDLLFCISTIVTGFLALFFNFENAFPLYFSLAHATGFATCLLSITRAISIKCPFYVLKQKTVAIVSVAYFTLELLAYVLVMATWSKALQDRRKIITGYFIQQGLLGAIIFIVIGSNIVVVIGIIKDSLGRTKRKICKRKKYATMTVLILSALFCFFNITFMTNGFIDLYLRSKGRWDLHELRAVLTWLPMPLNSAINPLVYIVRKKEMREYIIKELWSKIAGKMVRKVEQNNVEDNGEQCNITRVV